MDRKLIGALALLLSSLGCCACDCSCDYLPPVLDGPYASHGGRLGSASAGYYSAPTQIVGEEITPLPAEE